MKKVFLGFLVLLIIYGTTGSKQNIYSQDSGTIGELRRIEGSITETDQEKAKKDQKKAEEAVKTNLKELEKKQKSRINFNCGNIGQRCCTEADAPQLPLVSNLSGGQELLNEEAKQSQKEIDALIAQAPCNIGGIAIVDPQNPNSCTCQKEIRNLKTLCNGIENPTEREKLCKVTCSGVWTALGCVDLQLSGFIKNFLLGWGIGLAGVVALLCIIYSAFVLQISGGNPEKIKKAKERLTACIIGLLLIIFSVFILRIVGFDILQIPVFGI